MDKDRIKGAAKQVAGNIKQSVGKALGDGKMQADGAAQTAAGKGQNAVGGMTAAVRDADKKSGPAHAQGSGGVFCRPVPAPSERIARRWNFAPRQAVQWDDRCSRIARAQQSCVRLPLRSEDEMSQRAPDRQPRSRGDAATN